MKVDFSAFSRMTCHSDSCVSLYCTILRLLTFNWNGIEKPPHKYKSFLTFVPLCSCSRQTFGISSRHQIENIPHKFFYWKSNPMNLNPSSEVQTLLFLYRCILDSSFNLFGIRIRQHIKNSYGFKYISTNLDQRFMNILQISNLFKKKSRILAKYIHI